MLNSNRKRPVHTGILKGVLLGGGQQMYEITVGHGDDVGDINFTVPLSYNKKRMDKFGYGRSTSQRLDMLISVGIHEDKDPVDILLAASKISDLNYRHHIVRDFRKVFEQMKEIKELLPFEIFMATSGPYGPNDIGTSLEQ